MTKKILSSIFSMLLFVSLAQAQTAEITLQLNEKFFDTLLDAVFNNSRPLEFPIGSNTGFSNETKIISTSFAENTDVNSPNKSAQCREKITVMREMNGVRTAVKFRDGGIFAPIAFSGTYNPPFVGCVDFQGLAETNIELEFDKEKQTLYGRARVTNVQLGSVANLAGGLIARFVQSSIDKKINPIEILKTDKLDFVFPIQQTNSSLRLKANNMRYDVGENVLNIHVNLEFLKTN